MVNGNGSLMQASIHLERDTATNRIQCRNCQCNKHSPNHVHTYLFILQKNTALYDLFQSILEGAVPERAYVWMDHNSIRSKSRLRTLISRENNKIQIDLPDGSTLPHAHMFIWAMFGVLGADSLNCF